MEPVTVVVASFLFFVFLERIAFPLFSPMVSSYNRLSADNKLEWNLRCNSNVHAIIVTITALYVVFYESSTKSYDQLLWLDSELASYNIAWTCGFMLADLLSMFVYFEKVGGSMAFVLHHLIAIAGYYICLSNGFLTFHTNFRIISEMSTTFVNIRWMLSVSEMKYKRRYFYNGIIMTTTFFISRIFLSPFFWISALGMISTDVYQKSMGGTTHVIWIGLCLMLDCFNVMWMNKMLRGIFSFLKKKKLAEE